MHISADAVLLPAHHQSDLAVGLKPQKAIDHMTSGLLKHFCPDNIVLLVKTGLQLHQYGDLLAVLRCLGQSRDNG